MQAQPPPSPDAQAEIEMIKGIVAKYFPIYETKLSYDSISFRVTIDKTMLDENFRRMREELSLKKYTPVITYDKGEHIVVVGRLPEPKKRGYWINVALLIATFITTIIAGIILWKGYVNEVTGEFFTVDSIIMGTLTFALPLMAILGIHEMGHYFVARRNNIPASLPYFIPAPPPLPLGTFGAFISIRGPIPDRKALFDIGVAGPIAGFLATIPIAIVGLMLTNSGAQLASEETGGAMLVSFPLIYQALGMFLPVPDNYLLHPTAFAAWVGFLVTAINLLPAGTLDGGHIARAAFGTKAKYVSWLAVGLMFIIGFFWYTGWMLFGIIILFLGMNHAPPLNDITPLKSGRKLLGIGMAAMLVTSFVAIPFEYIQPDYGFTADLKGNSFGEISYSQNHTFEVLLTNRGNMNSTIVFDLQGDYYITDIGFSVTYSTEGSPNKTAVNNQVPLRVNGNATAYVSATVKIPITSDRSVNGSIVMNAKEDTTVTKIIGVLLRERAGSLNSSVDPANAAMSPSQTKSFFVNITNNFHFTIGVNLTAIAPAGWSAWLYIGSPAGATGRFTVNVTENATATVMLDVLCPASAVSGTNVMVQIEVATVSPATMKTIDIPISVA